MSPGPPQGSRCGLGTVEVARIERMLQEHRPEELAQLFSGQELVDAGTGPGRAASLAARFAAKEACCKLFPRETALGVIGATDFSVERDAYGAPCVKPSSAAQTVLDRHRVYRIHISLTHTETSASAMTWTETQRTEVPWFGKLFYHLWPYRRAVVLGNFRRVFGEVVPAKEIKRLAQAYYAHYIRFTLEFLRLPLMSQRQRKELIRLENIESPVRAGEMGKKGLILLTGHFGNFEVSTVAGIGQFPHYQGKFHFVRRMLKPRLLNDFITWRFRRAGFGTLPKRGSLDRIFELLAEGAVIVYVLDQHASRKDGVIADCSDHPAGTFKSVALLALSTGVPVIPAFSWREPDGKHVLRFEDPLPLIECDDASEAILLNTRAYNAALERMLLRHPEQWIWMHRRWKASGG